jgi:hypothetical protein
MAGAGEELDGSLWSWSGHGFGSDFANQISLVPMQQVRLKIAFYCIGIYLIFFISSLRNTLLRKSGS